MFGWYSRQERAGIACRPESKAPHRARRLGFEALDARTVLSAMPIGAADFPTEALRSADTSVANENDAIVALAAPQGTDKTVIMSGLTYTFTPADFGFSDPDDLPPDLFQAVMITTLPFPGTLIDRGGVAPGQFIPLADLQTGQLQFTTSGVEDASVASFTFQVQDNATGGVTLDPTPNTFTLIFDNEVTNFARGLYLDILEREPDLGGLTDWVNLLDDGASNLDVATALWETPEHRGIQVDGFYSQFLDRAPDPAGRQFWINQFLAGMSEETMMAQFLTTVEYQLNNPSNEAFVIAVYRDVLNRDPDPGGQAFWVGALDTGLMTRSQVASGLINTPERHIQLVTSYYLDFLQRQPDSLGLAFWVGQLNVGLLGDAEVAEALLATPEYAGLQH